MVAKVSPSCVKKTANISISLFDLFCEVLQAKVENIFKNFNDGGDDGGLSDLPHYL